MGSQITKEYDVGAVVGSGGVGCAWRIHTATKRANGEKVSIFLFERKQYERYPKAILDIVLERMKKEMTQLVRLRHPSVVRVMQTFDDGKGELAIVTEPIAFSMANVLMKNYHQVTPITDEMRNYSFEDVEIRMGALQIASFLAFAHNDAKLIHGNIAPESIFITESGAWKVAGFGFAQQFDPMGLTKTLPEYQAVDNAPTSCFTKPNPSFMAPEMVLTTSYDHRVDIFSLACLIYSAFNRGESFIPNYASITHLQQAIHSFGHADLKSVPRAGQELLREMLSVDPRLRSTPKDIENHGFFNDFSIKVLVFLEEFAAREDREKAQFLKGLSQNLEQLPKRILEKRILKHLFQELSNTPLIPLILLNIMGIAKRQTKDEFTKTTLPKIVPLMKIQDSPQVQVILLQNLPMLVEYTTKEQAKAHLLPMLVNGMCDSREIVQEEALKHAYDVIKEFDLETMKKSIVPKLMGLFQSQTTLSIKVLLLVTWAKIVPILDNPTVEQTLLPAVDNWANHLVAEPSSSTSPDRVNPYTVSPALLMGILGVYEASYPVVDVNILGLRLIPIVCRLSVHPALGIQQYESFATCLRAMLARVEEHRRRELSNRREFEVSRNAKPSGGDVATSGTGDTFTSLISGPSLLSTVTSHAPTRSASVSSASSTIPAYVAPSSPPIPTPYTTSTTTQQGRSMLDSMFPATSSTQESNPATKPLAPSNSSSTFAMFSSPPPQPSTYVTPQQNITPAPYAAQPQPAYASMMQTPLDALSPARQAPPPLPSSSSSSSSSSILPSNPTLDSGASLYASAYRPTQAVNSIPSIPSMYSAPAAQSGGWSSAQPKSQPTVQYDSLDSLFGGASQQKTNTSTPHKSDLDAWLDSPTPTQTTSSALYHTNYAPQQTLAPSANALDDFFGSSSSGQSLPPSGMVCD
eukprot:TRINITY_DN2445_c0_g1_i5.p1 TRINITY_DN2445_c0_g1~~TRINITY_DN2445_c0_g1_i5.p1  ORF type:complete len:919 (+),score=220.08 TRINITY_DN2445_c0_g1_i5:96-2852(+)